MRTHRCIYNTSMSIQSSDIKAATSADYKYSETQTHTHFQIHLSQIQQPPTYMLQHSDTVYRVKTTLRTGNPTGVELNAGSFSTITCLCVVDMFMNAVCETVRDTYIESWERFFRSVFPNPKSCKVELNVFFCSNISLLVISMSG